MPTGRYCILILFYCYRTHTYIHVAPYLPARCYLRARRRPPGGRGRGRTVRDDGSNHENCVSLLFNVDDICTCVYYCFVVATCVQIREGNGPRTGERPKGVRGAGSAGRPPVANCRRRLTGNLSGTRQHKREELKKHEIY